MSISSEQLSEPCRSELLRIVSYVSDKELNTLLKTEPSFSSGGFRSHKPALLRKRLEQLVLGGNEVSAQIRNLLASHSRSASLLTHLSSDTLTATAAAWSAVLGEHVFLVAALLDKRQEIRKKAEIWLRRTPHFIQLKPEKAIDELSEIFGDITELLNVDPAHAPTVTKESWNEQKEKLNQRIKKLQSENRRLKGVDDKNRRTATLLEKEKEENARLTEKLKEKRNADKKLVRELEFVKAELQRETTRREERLQSALDLSLSKEFHGWLAEAKAVEIEVQHRTASEDIIDFAREALKKQQENDKHSGNRAMLKKRLRELEDLHGNVQDTLRNAISQSPQLKLAAEKLDDEIKHLSELLHLHTEPPPLEKELINRIHSTPDEFISQLRKLSKELKSLKLINKKAFRNIEAEFRKRMDTIQSLGVPVDPEQQTRKDAASLLSLALSGKRSAMLLLDGHNVLFGLQARYMPPRGKAVPDKEKRHNLVNDVIRIAAPNPALRAFVHFDGHTRSDSDPAPNVRVTYSGGEGEHRADKVIIDQIRFLKSSSPETDVLLVSNDNDLCKEARRLGAKDMAVLDFGAFL
ncbi:MAG: hypothetical protein R6V06_09860 [Kiritimatiellia bacterium]